jgi:3-hydroxyacyl-CoA dehydrogenase
MTSAQEVRTVGVVGTGALGAGWVALALSRGLEVVATDPAPDAESRLRAVVTTLLRELGQELGEGRLRFVPDVSQVGREADLVVESGPERLDLKREIFAALDEAAAPETLLTSSSSGLMPSTFQDACRHHPERVLVAHPFNPPHLMPLVEIVGGRQTSEEAVERAMATFTQLGKKPIRLRRELPGHVANRLQAALWREAYHLVEQGAVDVADVDTAIASGPGLRWSLLGPFATQHVSGGAGGLAHVLEHLGPPMVEWWKDLGDPALTPELTDTLVEGVRRELVDTDVDELVARRDRALRALMDLKTSHGLG